MSGALKNNFHVICQTSRTFASSIPASLAAWGGGEPDEIAERIRLHLPSRCCRRRTADSDQPMARGDCAHQQGSQPNWNCDSGSRRIPQQDYVCQGIR